MNENNSVYLAWQAPDTREWHVVGLLQEQQQGYRFDYTRGAKASDKFIPFSGMETLEHSYLSEELFPLFKNRILSRRRPEYPAFIQWLGLPEDEISPVNLLARSGGLRGTDQLQMFKRIEVKADGTFEHIFFVHGLRHLPASAQARVKTLTQGDQLLLVPDCQNPHDPYAVLIRADRPAEIIGYCPRYLARDIAQLLEHRPDSVKLFVEASSADAPTNYQLMCRLVGQLDAEVDTGLMQQQEFIPLSH